MKDPVAVQETWFPSLGQEDPLQKRMATQSSVLAWRIPWTEEPGELQSMGFQRVEHDCATNTFTFTMLMIKCLKFFGCYEENLKHSDKEH